MVLPSLPVVIMDLHWKGVFKMAGEPLYFHDFRLKFVFSQTSLVVPKMAIWELDLAKQNKKMSMLLFLTVSVESST